MSDSEHSRYIHMGGCCSFPLRTIQDIGFTRVDGPPLCQRGAHVDEILSGEEAATTLLLPHPQQFHQDYVPESDLEEDDEDPEEDPADYLADRDDDDEDEDKEEDEEEEEEHPAPTDSVPPIHCMTARISIRDEPSISLPPREEVERLLALTTPPPSPLTPLSSPLPQIPLPPLPIPSPPNSPTHIEIPESCLPLRKWVRFASSYPSHESGGVQQPVAVVTTSMYGIRPFIVDLTVMIERERPKMAYGRLGIYPWMLAIWHVQDVMSLRTTGSGHSALISELQSADHRRQRVISELLASDHKRQVQLTKTLRLLKGTQTHYGRVSDGSIDPQ
ncbi:hypothetical protein Tco_1402742 [Tanacetum coccineum]